MHLKNPSSREKMGEGFREIGGEKEEVRGGGRRIKKK